MKQNNGDKYVRIILLRLHKKPFSLFCLIVNERKLDGWPDDSCAITS